MRFSNRPILTALACSALMIGAPINVTAQDITGTAKALDGDTLDFTGIRIDLAGIDAPELKQTCTSDSGERACGEEAKSLLSELIKGQELSCQSQSISSDGITLAVCERAGLDIGLAMIESGLVIALPEAPEAYAQAEALRQTHKIGIWSGDFEKPELWRAANPEKVVKSVQRAASPTRPPNRQTEQVYRNSFGCAIKGNRNRRGEWIYHMPGAPYYDQTRPEELFCTETQARQAGYRRSKA